MGLLQAFEELCAADESIGEIVTEITDGIVECGESIIDAIDDFVVKLDDIQAKLDEESYQSTDRLNPESETTPEMTALNNAVDSIETLFDTVSGKIDEVVFGREGEEQVN